MKTDWLIAGSARYVGAIMGCAILLLPRAGFTANAVTPAPPSAIAAIASGSDSVSGGTAAAFVFSQGIEIAPDAVLSGGSGGAVSIGAAALNNVSGVAAINLAVGTGNQQANNIRIGTAVNGGSGSAGSGSLNIEAAQTIDDSGVLDATAVNGLGDSASLGPNALQNVSGVVAINLAAGTANQQINNIVWQNKPAAPLSGTVAH
jgi:hypothetical protein